MWIQLKLHHANMVMELWNEAWVAQVLWRTWLKPAILQPAVISSLQSQTQLFTFTSFLRVVCVSSLGLKDTVVAKENLVLTAVGRQVTYFNPSTTNVFTLIFLSSPRPASYRSFCHFPGSFSTRTLLEHYLTSRDVYCCSSWFLAFFFL